MTVTEMREVPLEKGPVEFRGALDVERTDAGLLPWRLPAWTRAQYPDTWMGHVASMPSGVRLALRTTARSLEAEFLTTVTRFPGTPEPPFAGLLELLVDGVSARRAEMPVGDVLRLSDRFEEVETVPGRPGRVRFDALPDGMKDIELWLPQQTRTEVTGLWADAEVLPPRPTGRRRWLHHGSSISHCNEADTPTGSWPVIAAGLGRAEIVNLSLAGGAQLDPYVARTIRDEPADLISVKLGINVVNQASFRLRSFGPAVDGFLDTIREGHPDTPLLVVSPVICPPVEDTPGPTAVDVTADGPRTVALGDRNDVAGGALTLTVIREELSRIVARRARHDPRLHYLDGRELFGTDDVPDLPDHLHPNAAGYRRMGERFAALAFGPRGPFA